MKKTARRCLETAAGPNFNYRVATTRTSLAKPAPQSKRTTER